MTRERTRLLTVTERIRRDTLAHQRLASIGVEPQATGGPVALGEGLTRRGRDQLFGRDARRGTYIPKGRPTPEPSLFTRVVQAIQYSRIYKVDFPQILLDFTSWFNTFSTDINWRNPWGGQEVDKNDVIFVGAYQARILSHNLREIANLIEEDIQRLDHARRELEEQLPSHYTSPWTEDEETGLLWNNLDGQTASLHKPHYV